MGSTNAGSMPLPIHLALQGGGAHGALTWGVLDRLLEADRFAIPVSYTHLTLPTICSV